MGILKKTAYVALLGVSACAGDKYNFMERVTHKPAQYTTAETITRSSTMLRSLDDSRVYGVLDDRIDSMNDAHAYTLVKDRLDDLPQRYQMQAFSQLGNTIVQRDSLITKMDSPGYQGVLGTCIMLQASVLQRAKQQN